MATTHGIVGTMIMQSVPNPFIAGALIVASHYLLDIIPHWDFGTDWTKRSKKTTGALAIADTAMGFLVPIFAFSHTLSLPLILLAVSLANLPDWIMAPYFMLAASKEKTKSLKESAFGKLYESFLEWQNNYFHRTTTFTHGISTQIAIILFFFFLLSFHL